MTNDERAAYEETRKVRIAEQKAENRARELKWQADLEVRKQKRALEHLHTMAKKARLLTEIAEEHGTTLQDLVVVMNNHSLDVIGDNIGGIYIDASEIAEYIAKYL